MKLRLQTIEANKSTFEFVGSIVTIGRDAGCDLPMPGTSNVSGRHAQITLTADGAYLTDLESTNGTFLNDRRIEGRKGLRKGDYFRLGQTGPCFQVVELDLNHAAAVAVNVGTARENVNGGQYDVELAPPRPAKPHKPAPAPLRPTPKAPDPSPVAPPVAASGQTRLMVVELQKKNRTLIVAIGAAVGALLLIGGLTAIYFTWKTSRLDDTAKQLQAKTDDINQTVGKVASNVEKLSKSDEDEIFARYADAVFHVEIEGEKKGWVVNGTAFAFDKNGKLGTNGHVTNPAIRALKAKRSVVVIAHGGKKIYPVTAAASHPQYDETKGYQTPDVGILTIGLPAGEQLPAAVVLASDDDLGKLRPGVSLCYIGFPGWSDYGSLKKIEPHLYKGGLSRLVTLKEESGDFSNQFLLQHDMQTTGGASGSPIFNRAGRVVAIHNSGKSVYVVDAQGKTQRIPAGWRAGMRIDLLKQMMK